MSSTTDFLTTQKNGVIAINNVNQTTAYYAGKFTTNAVTTTTLAAAGSGYLVNFAVVVAGAAGTINNSATTAGVASSNAIVATPATVGIYPVGARFTNGLVLAPGAGQTLVATYSLD